MDNEMNRGQARPWTARVSRRTLLMGALGVSASALLAACGADDDDEEQGSAPTASATPAGSGPEPTESNTESEPTQTESDAESASTRTFIDETGQEIEVPDRAERIVAIHDINGGSQLLSLGAPVVGIAVRDSGHRDDMTRYFDVESLATVGQVYEPDIEAIAALQPDLIVGEGFDGGGMGFDEAVQAQLEAIAPVVYIDTFRPLDEVMADFVELLGPDYAAVAEEQQGELDSLVEEIRDVFGEEWSSITASLVGKNGDIVEAWGPTALVPNDILTRVGVNWVPIMIEAGLPENGGYISGGLSVERLGEYEADLILVQTVWEPSILDEPLYQSLQAVEQGQVIELAEGIAGTHYANYLYIAEFLLEELQSISDGFDTDIVEESAASGSAEAYPVTIEHKYGSTTIEALPERIVLVGLVEQDALLALGTVPVATREWYGGRPGAIFPWAEDQLGDAELPEVLDATELDFEQIAALQPDLIVGLYAGTTPEEYETLAQIAPTVAQPAEYVDWGIPWQELTVTIGQIVGKQQDAEALVADVEQAFATAREEHPEFSSATAAVASPFGFPENFWVYSSQDVRGRIMTSLGFEVPSVFDDMAGEEFGATVSIEQLDLLADLDVLIWVANADDFGDMPLYEALPVVQEGRALYYGDGNPVYDALNFGTVLSLPYVVENLVPDLVIAVDGDPDTSVDD